MRILLFILLLPLILSAQNYRSPEITWSTLVGGNDQEEIYDLAELPNGNIMAVGYTRSKANKMEDLYYFILNSDGKKLVAVNYGSLQDDRALGVTTTFDGKFMYCGYLQVDPLHGLHKVPILRKVDQTGNPLYSVFEKNIQGSYKDLIELSPGKTIVIGEEMDQGILVQYNNEKLIWKKSISGTKVRLNSILPISDSTFLISGLSLNDNLLWYALYDDHGNMIWTKKGPKYFGEGKSMILESNQYCWIGGSYYDSHTREDGYLMKIKIQDGSIISKANYGNKYDDVLNSIAYTAESHLFISGKTYSHIRGGARRSKAWMVEVDSKTLKPIGDQYLWGGKQNNEITCMKYSGRGHLLLGGWTASGEAERQDGWLMEIPSTENQNDLMVPGIDITDFSVQDADGDGKIGYTEASSFQVGYLRSNRSVAAFPKFIVFIDGQKVSYDVLLDLNHQGGKFNIPYYRENDLVGIHHVKLILMDGKSNRLDSVERLVEFLPSEQSKILLAFDQPRLKEKLENGQAVIELPLRFYNSGMQDLSAIRTTLIGLDEAPYVFRDTLIALKSKESFTGVVTIKPQEIIASDSIVIKAITTSDSTTYTHSMVLHIKTLLEPWIKARKEQTTVLIAEKLSTKSLDASGTISPITSEDYKKLPLDSFFLKVSNWKVELGAVTSTIKSFDQNKLFMIWIDPDQVVTNNYFISKRNKHTILLKLISQDQNAEGLEAKLIIERPHLSGIDTIVVPLEQGVLFGSYQYNIQLDIPLVEGENKVSLTLWNRNELIKSSNKMIIKYEPPKSNLFIFAYGIPAAGLKQVTKDAADLADAFHDQNGKIFSSIQSKVFNTKDQTGTQEIKKSIRSIVNDYFEFKRIQKNDVILIYISSHGSLIRNELHIHSSDYDPIYEDETTLNFQKDIQEKLKDLPCKKIFLIDACHSGAAGTLAADNGTKGNEMSEDLANALIKLSESSNDFYYLLSSSAGESSYTDDAWGNSAFTKGILEAFHNQTERTLQGTQQADEDHNKIIDLKELFDYIKERVPVIIQSKKDLKSSQTPYTPDEKVLKGIPIFVLRS